MDSPKYDLDDLDAAAEVFPQGKEALAIERVRDISAWFQHVQDVTPRLRRLRIAAIEHLRTQGKTKPEIAQLCGISEHRVNEILKSVRPNRINAA